MSDEMILRAYGKINLGLDVLGKRPDGYHEVRMIMQTVTLYDRLRIRRTKEPGIRLSSNLYFLPTGKDNLVYRAAELLMKERGVKEGVSITLQKCIPVAAGMAGGSSDAAAALIGVNRLFGLGFTRKELMERGVSLGADIPYCIMRGTALAEGIGERLRRLAPMPECFIVLAKPPVSVSTKFVYGNLKADEIKSHPDIEGMERALQTGSLEGIAACMGNVLETVTIAAYPVVGEIKERMREDGAAAALMSGSGPTVFGIFEEKEAADRCRMKLRTDGLVKQAYTVRPFNKRV